MRTTPWQMLLFAMAGWINRYQQAKLEFCLEQIGTYKQLHGGKPLRLNDDRRRRCRHLHELPPVLFQNSIERSCRFSIVMIEEPAESFASGDRA